MQVTKLNHICKISHAFFLLFLFVIIFLHCFAPFVVGEIITTGKIEPDDPLTWKKTMFAGVGRNGDGTMKITNGSEVYGQYINIGVEADDKGKVTVDGVGSKLDVNPRFCVGFYGHGILDITNGATVNAGSGQIGIQSNQKAIGIVTVDGKGSTWNNQALTVGRGGKGTLNITNGGTVVCENDTWIARISRYSSSINFDNGTLITGGLFFGPDDLTGKGTIHASGLVSNMDLVFDQARGKSQTFNINNNKGQDIELHLSLDEATVLGAGYNKSGSLSVLEGSVITSKGGYIGCQKGSQGFVSVDGEGSKWISTDFMNVGYEYGGKGTLMITNGGTVKNIRGRLYSSNGKAVVDGANSRWINKTLEVGICDNGAALKIINGGEVIVEGNTTVAHNPAASTIHFDNGTLTTGGLICDFADLTGTGTVNVSGLVVDRDMIFDKKNGLKQTFVINETAGQNITLNLNVDGAGCLGAGYNGQGEMTVTDGVVVKSSSGWIAQNRGSTGNVTVDGKGSAWINSGSLHVAYRGPGTLKISNGGRVSNKYVSVGSSAKGIVTVDGSGSKLTSTEVLGVGRSNEGTLVITNGGNVISGGFSIGSNGGSTGEVIVKGQGCLLDCRYLDIGHFGKATLNITGGAVVTCRYSQIGLDAYKTKSTGVVNVDGAGSAWKIATTLTAGRKGRAVINISDGGLVSAAGTVTVDKDNDGDSFINISGGGMLAIKGDAAASLDKFLALITAAGSVRCWDKSVNDWADIKGAKNGTDYTLKYVKKGDLAGYNLLTVLTPGPENE